MTTSFLKNALLALLLAGLGFSAVPVTRVLAADEKPPLGEVDNEKLEERWSRQLKAFGILGRVFEDPDGHLQRFQELIDRGAAKGRDVSGVQAALDAYESALKNARPIYQSAQGIANSHRGFDESGRVVDAVQAKATLQEMRSKIQEIKSAMGGTFKALREAIKAYRFANRPASLPTERDS